MLSMPSRKFIALVLTAIVGGTGAWAWYSHMGPFAGPAAAAHATPAEADPYVRFDMEAYDLIKKNYWMESSQYDLPKLFALSAQKVTNASTTLATSTREATAAMLGDVFKTATSTDERRQWAKDTLTIVLYNLVPVGRDQLLSQKQETQLRQEVANVNPQKDLYGDLGLAKGASQSAVDTAYKQKSAELAASSSPAAKAELQKVAYAHNVLGSGVSKTLYDQSQAEPTVFGHAIGRTLYLDVQQIAPTTLVEFAAAIDNASTTPLDSMIIDFRGNIGGALDFARFFLGLFMGPNQYAFDLFSQAQYQPQRTPENIPKISELGRYAHIVILADHMSQSTAELTSSVLRRYHLATVVGERTRGWGSVENTYKLETVIDADTTYALELVNSLTLGADQQPIEQNGIAPDIDVGSADWKSAVRRALPADLSAAVIQMESRDPWKF
jgi:curved DNA-binding protein CbpA